MYTSEELLKLAALNARTDKAFDTRIKTQLTNKASILDYTQGGALSPNARKAELENVQRLKQRLQATRNAGVNIPSNVRTQLLTDTQRDLNAATKRLKVKGVPKLLDKEGLGTFHEIFAPVDREYTAWDNIKRLGKRGVKTLGNAWKGNNFTHNKWITRGGLIGGGLMAGAGIASLLSDDKPQQQNVGNVNGYGSNGYGSNGYGVYKQANDAIVPLMAAGVGGAGGYLVGSKFVNPSLDKQIAQNQRIIEQAENSIERSKSMQRYAPAGIALIGALSMLALASKIKDAHAVAQDVSSNLYGGGYNSAANGFYASEQRQNVY